MLGILKKEQEVMAINWETYRSIPFLMNYAEAKKHHDNTLPIRGDEYKTRPVGRRDQKWFSIWEASNAIHVGYGYGELDKRTKLVTFDPSGSITVHPARRSWGAATHERLSKLLGETFRTHQYDTWVNCVFFDNGTYRRGYLPLRRGIPTNFVRHGTHDLIFINYQFPVTHRVNSDKAKEVLRPFVPFLTYVEGVAKLQGRKSPEFSRETIAEIFGWRDGTEKWVMHPSPNSPPNLVWGENAPQHRDEMFALAASDDNMDQLRAAITLCHNAHWGTTPRQAFMEHLMRMRPNDLLDKREHRKGRMVTDRYRRFMD
jgi:hypothetical protein